MMLDYFDLQLFGEGGGDGGSSGGEGGEGFTGADIQNNDPELARIPERARETYRKAKAKAGASRAAASTEESENPTIETVDETDNANQRLSYADLIKSDEYKDEHHAYMEKAIQDRFRKYKGIEDKLSKSEEMLTKIAAKYGLDSASPTFIDDLSSRIDEDDSYYEDYALEHDMSTKEAKEVLQMKQRLARAEALEAQRKQEEEDNARIQALQRSAEQTKQRYPSFDLRTELQNERFRRILGATQGDTKAAYEAVHFDEIQNAMRVSAQQMAQAAVNKAQTQTAQAIASNRRRPVESGLSSQPAISQEAEIERIKHMSRKELAEYAAELRKAKR